jgi:hypothetical protein
MANAAEETTRRPDRHPPGKFILLSLFEVVSFRLENDKISPLKLRDTQISENL